MNPEVLIRQIAQWPALLLLLTIPPSWFTIPMGVLVLICGVFWTFSFCAEHASQGMKVFNRGADKAP